MRNGFTLIEILMAVLLIGVVSLSFGALQGIAHTFFFQSVGMANAQGEASYAMLHMKRNISKANRVVIISPTQLSFRYDHRSITAGTATPTDMNDDEWDYYRLNGTTLEYMNNFTAGPVAGGGDVTAIAIVIDGEEVIARGVTALAFTQASPAEVDIDLTVQQQVGLQARSSRVRGSITPRGIGSN